VTTPAYPNPLLPGFNPDPSVVEVDGEYYLVTSTFEYLPGLPVYHSSDLVTWTQIGNVATRPGQLNVSEIPTGGGVWAPTIRYREGTFYVIVVVAMGGGCLLYTATDPAGPWSDPTSVTGFDGIDPDLAWGDDGTAYVTYSGLETNGGDMHEHKGIQQVEIDLATGAALTPPTSLYSGTGLKFPEAPHLYHRGEWWYLMIAEGGTERGHGVSIARGAAPDGPFEGYANNPFLSARSTNRPIQNTGHADLVTRPDGGDALVLLGMRPRGGTQAFSALGRETFITTIEWVDGWPVAEPVVLNPRAGGTDEHIDFANTPELDDAWMGVRRRAVDLAAFENGTLVLDGDGTTLEDARPTFIGRRQLSQTARVTTTVDVAAGVGGLAVRYDEKHFVQVEAAGGGAGASTTVTGRYQLSGLFQEWSATLPAGDVTLEIDAVPVVMTGFDSNFLSPDTIVLRASAGGESVTLAELDGRYLTAETAGSFTGRVVGLYAVSGRVAFSGYDAVGSED